eukprot:CAMPEP_0168618668 /NCGR_PEP_ID=MMETSP0449_2-20121227/6192_1 /TAXON_ID=1082188 /ORGANISM="Strombidium rassoulzadegani, Strain ras09" /LENGTH=74 /DNA_ID=CAMNT_0008659553 /DNA_START=437 /DNA_END=658 /DNA_ORIENTATION=+
MDLMVAAIVRELAADRLGRGVGNEDAPELLPALDQFPPVGYISDGGIRSILLGLGFRNLVKNVGRHLLAHYNER